MLKKMGGILLPSELILRLQKDILGNFNSVRVDPTRTSPSPSPSGPVLLLYLPNIPH